jgi:hypothetical protein
MTAPFVLFEKSLLFGKFACKFDHAKIKFTDISLVKAAFAELRCPPFGRHDWRPTNRQDHAGAGDLS